MHNYGGQGHSGLLLITSKPTVSIIYISELHISKFDISMAVTCGIYSLQALLQTMEEQRRLIFQELVVEKGIIDRPGLEWTGVG